MKRSGAGPMRFFLASLFILPVLAFSSCPATPEPRLSAPRPIPVSVSVQDGERESALVEPAEESSVVAGDHAAALSPVSKKGSGTAEREKASSLGNRAAASVPAASAPAASAEAKDGESRLILAFSADTHYGSTQANARERAEMLESVSASGAAAFYLAGDITEFGMRSQWMDAASSLSAGLKGTPFASVLGNHDVMGNGRRWWNEYLNRDPAARDGRFEHRWPGIRVIGIELTSRLTGWTAERESWLRARLAASRPDELLIVVSHMYYYSSGIDGWSDDPATIQRFCRLFAESGVDLVVSGHNHYMELLEADGVKYAVIGAGGAPFDPEPTYASPKSAWFLRGKRGWLEVESRGGGKGAVLRFRSSRGETLLERPL